MSVVGSERRDIMIWRKFFLSLIFPGCLFISSSFALADYPTRPINLIFSFGAGSGSDITGRAMANEASKILKQPIICSNQVGGGGTLSLGKLKGEKPDGYMVVNTTTGAFCRSPHMQPVPYDALKDFTFIMQYALFQYGIVVRSDSPWKTLEEFIDYAKKNPRKITYGTAGVGLGQHLVMEYLGKKLGIQWDHVPFTGGPQTVTALLGGHVNAIAQTSEWTEYVRSGRLRLLAILTSKRMKSFPDVPTLMEKGYPFAVHAGPCFVGPAGMPKPIVEKLQNAFHQAMESKSFLDAMDRIEYTIDYKDSEALTKFIHQDYKETGDLIKILGMGLYKK